MEQCVYYKLQIPKFSFPIHTNQVSLIEEKCTIQSMSKNINIQDHSISREMFTLVYDPELDYYITQPIPKNIAAYYESDVYISHTDSIDSIKDKLYQFVKKINLRKKIKLIDALYHPHKTVLDIGAGTGDFLKAAENYGWNISGVEPNSKARQLALNKNISLAANIQEISDKRFDVITLWHVLEHLPDLDSDIQKFKQLLNPKGTLVIAVPNYKSYDAKHYKEFWAAYDVPRHLYHFSQNSINRIFSKYDFQLLATKPMVFDSYYVSLLSEKYKTGNHNFFKAFLYGTLSNISAYFTKEHSSIIYILKKS